MDRWQQTDPVDDIIKNGMAAKVPESKLINRKIEQAYAEIRSMQSISAGAEKPAGPRPKKGVPTADANKPAVRRKNKKSPAPKYTAAAALFLAAALLFTKVPALAAQIPIIGHIFKSLEQDVPYPGNYSENSVALPPLPEETGGQGEEKAGQDTALTPRQVTAGGMTVTLSEVTYDRNAIYLALLIENESGFAPNAQSDDMMYLQCRADMYTADNTKKTFSEESGNPLAYTTQGTFIDSHTFKGLVQLTDFGFSLSDYTGCDLTFFTFIQELTTGTTLTGTLDGESETISYMEFDRKTYEGPWTFHLDFSDVQTTEQEIFVNQTNDQGLGIQKMVKTEYELYAVPIFPEEAASEDYVVTIWDADGNPLESHGDNLEIRSIYGRDVSTVTVYILKWDDFVESKGSNSYLQPEKAVFTTVVNLP